MSGDLITKRMERLEMTATELAALLGTTRQSVEGWMRTTQPTGGTLVRLAEALECEITDIVVRE